MIDSRFFYCQGPYRLSDLVAEFGGSLNHEADTLISAPATLAQAGCGQIAFFSNNKYSTQFQNTSASVCIVAKDFSSTNHKGSLILWRVDEPYAVWAKVLQKFYPMDGRKAVSDPAAVHHTSHIAHSACLGAGAVVGEGCYIGEHCYIGPGVQIADNTIIYHGCTITHAIIGQGCIIHPGVRIGQDGFGFAISSGGMLKVPQLGRVLLGNGVEIGANSCIDRGAIADTIIGDNCKLDNLVQIGHNVVLGAGCVVVAQVGIAGSTEVGAGTLIGGQSGIAGHLKVGKNVQLAARSGVIRDVADGAIMGGTPAVPVKQWHRQNIMLQKLSNKEG